MAMTSAAASTAVRGTLTADADVAAWRDSGSRTLQIRQVPVARIRPEEGLGRKRDREGHRELQRSIERFGVLTPITVRRAPDATGDYLLIKGQGRTLACRILGIETIPAVVVDDHYTDDEKVQQFLVENVARLKMRPVDRALLIARARYEGEETVDVAKRFGVSAATVRRLEGQLEGASNSEVAALRSGRVNLALHAVISRYVVPAERPEVVATVARYAMRTREVEALFVALGWRRLVALGEEYRHQRLILLGWACSQLDQMAQGPEKERLRQLALRLPLAFESDGGIASLVVR
ncbi:MAG: ParB/RepB/Spo0J family partition protein [Streptosporangiaceae bacterium]|nr:ParB/RepB/Spo0J family partition protein [Streptosporangiaceae bacterium]MBV9857918.1 ParB/RepB/Spo0J family partition protein [Streptosporangiaceae bacterium]